MNLNHSAKLFWVGSGAGPFILIPSALLPDWSGINVPDYRVVNATFRWNESESRASDYDRACDVDDYVGVITVGFGEALVLGDEPNQTAWLPLNSGGFLVRWEYAEDDRAMEAALASIPPTLIWEPKDTFVVGSSPLELFSAAEPGMEPSSKRLEINLQPGSYDVLWARYAPNDLTAATLIALRRRAA